MVKVRKFQGYLADQPNVKRIIAPPYDVLNTEEAILMAEGNEMSFLHANKPEIDLPIGTDPYDEAVYQKGKENLGNITTAVQALIYIVENFVKKGYLKQDAIARMYIYMQKMGGKSPQYGIIGESSIDDYEKGIIKRHELTTYKKEADRTKLIDTQSANVGPVFLTFRNGVDIEERMMHIVDTVEPYANVVTDDDVGHCLWLCSEEDSDFFEKAFGNIPYSYIADGHHRAAASYNVGKKRKEAAIQSGQEITGEEEFNYFMTIMYPETYLSILDYNRVLKSLNGLSNQEFLERISDSYEIRQRDEGENPKPQAKFENSLYLGEKWYSLKIKAEKIDKSTHVSQLDSQLLTELVLKPILGIQDIRGDDRIDFVGGIRGIEGLVKRCNEDCVAAFAMFPVQLHELMDIADAGLIMPPKSTWFEPKPRSGFVVRIFK